MGPVVPTVQEWLVLDIAAAALCPAQQQPVHKCLCLKLAWLVLDTAVVVLHPAQQQLHAHCCVKQLGIMRQRGSCAERASMCSRNSTPAAQAATEQ
jgi:hypothetical protein